MAVTWLDTPGVQLRDRHDVIDLSVTDPDTSTLVAELRGGAVTEVVWIAGAFVAPYLQSTEAGGVFALRRSGGWPEPSVSIKVLEASDMATPIWEWNGVDTSQFESAPCEQTGLTSAAISVEDYAHLPGGKALRFQIVTPSAGAAKRAHWLAKDPLPPGRYQFQVEICGSTSVSGNSQYAGLWFAGDEAGTRVGLLGGTSYLRYVQRAGTVTDASTVRGAPWATSTWVAGSIFRADLDVQIVKPTGSWPRWTSSGLGRGTTMGVGVQTVRSHMTDIVASPGTAWDALPCDRWGIAQRHLSSSAETNNWDLLSLRIYRA